MIKKFEKIRVMFDNIAILNYVWNPLSFRDQKEKYPLFCDKMALLLKDNRANLHKEVLYALKPYIKIFKKIKKYEEKMYRSFSKKKIRITNETILIKYRFKIIYIYPFNNKKYTYVMPQMAANNLFVFLTKFVEKWNKHNNEFEIFIEEKEKEKRSKNNYLDYFIDYYHQL